MDKDLLTRWIEDLETSPPQTTGALVRTETYVGNPDANRAGYCCLGRLCVVAGVNFDDTNVIDDDGYAQGYNPFVEWWGLTREVVDDLISMNDDQRTFPEIAQWLRDNLLPIK